MKLLFEVDKKDYAACTHTYVRDSARSIIIRNGKAAMVHSLKYDYYKFPGGGIEKGEKPLDAMIRETREETGLIVIPESIREYGYVHRIQKSFHDETECFIQDNYYYLCEAYEHRVALELDTYESEESFTPEFVDPGTALAANRNAMLAYKHPVMLERDIRLLEMLKAEGRFV